jgi:hypothetical protein
MSADRIGLMVALALFLGLATYQITLPGLHYDEAFEVVPTMQLLLGEPTTTFRESGVRLGTWLLPLMTQDYIGALNTYLALPFFVALGISVTSLRLMVISLGILTLCLAYRFARELSGGPVAGGATALLLAVNPTFVFWNRQGVFVTSVTAAVGVAAAVAWLRWWRNGPRIYALVGAFLFGLGLYAKLLFLWLMLGLFAAAAVAVLLQFRGQWRCVPGAVRARVAEWRTVAWCAASFALGCAPLLLYNIQTGGTLGNVGKNLSTSYYGTNNLAFLPNLVERIRQFGAVLTGGHLWYLGGQYDNWFGPVVFLAALGGSVWLVVRGARGSRALLAPFVVTAAVIVASCATVSALWVTHFAVLAPWPPIAIGCCVAYVLNVRKGARVAGSAPEGCRKDTHGSGRQGRMVPAGVLSGVTIAALTLVGLSWMTDVATDVRYHQALATSGGVGAHSDAVYDLADWLSATRRTRAESGRGTMQVAAMDWGIAAPLSFLTHGDVNPIETFGYAWESDAQLAQRLEQFVRDAGTLYLWRAPDEIIFDRSAEFKQLYQPLGLEEDIVAAFYERSGRPVLGATQLVRKGTAVNPPKPLRPN